MGSDWPVVTQLKENKGRFHRELGDCGRKPSRGGKLRHKNVTHGRPTAPSSRPDTQIWFRFQMQSEDHIPDDNHLFLLPGFMIPGMSGKAKTISK